MPTIQLSLAYDTPAELADAQDEIRELFECRNEGVIDLGPVLRRVLAEAYHGADAVLIDATLA